MSLLISLKGYSGLLLQADICVSVISPVHLLSSAIRPKSAYCVKKLYKSMLTTIQLKVFPLSGWNPGFHWLECLSAGRSIEGAIACRQWPPLNYLLLLITIRHLSSFLRFFAVSANVRIAPAITNVHPAIGAVSPVPGPLLSPRTPTSAPLSGAAASPRTDISG